MPGVELNADVPATAGDDASLAAAFSRLDSASEVVDIDDAGPCDAVRKSPAKQQGRDEGDQATRPPEHWYSSLPATVSKLRQYQLGAVWAAIPF